MPPNRRILIEVCAGSLSDALLAAELGADRLEFCASLDVGGLTPTLEDVGRLRAAVSLPLAVMVRPRGGDFCYSETEWRSMLADAERRLQVGADAIVFGALTRDRKVDVARAKDMVSLVHGFPGKEVVFHRAFDEALNLQNTWVAMRDSGVDRVLTSGGPATALEGASTLASLVSASAMTRWRPTVLVGGGVRAENLVELLNRTQATQIHAACTGDARPLRLDGEKLRSLVSACRAYEALARQNAGAGESEK